ncbi:MAG: competence/damage-inducible protein A [Sorangium cellulosum]|nr:MAG: competence/damage-inducible protein A [Sorangium cellulosum]
MTAAVLSIGTEITRGEIVNTNANWLADRLTQIGFEVTEVASVADDQTMLVTELRRMSRAHQVVVCTGGLGPTSDDITSACAAMAAGVPLIRDVASIEAIAERFKRMNRSMVAANIKQADFPAGATIMPNAVGTAPGFWMHMGGAVVAFFPGVPREMHYLFDHHAAVVLQSRAPCNTFQVRLRTFGEGESALAEKLQGIESLYPNVTVGYRASFPEIEVKLLARGKNETHAKYLATEAAQQVKARLLSLVYGEGSCTLVGVTADAIRERGYKLAVAESCTGGLLTNLLTSESASDYLVAGLVTYANEAKTKLLGVSEQLLEEHGAVSEQVARAMAKGVAKAMGTELGVGITGIAGPTGGTVDKPIGLVHLAVAHPGGVEARHRVFSGDRDRVQRFAAFCALHLLRKCCLKR